MSDSRAALPLTAVIITHERARLLARAHASLEAAKERYRGEVEVLIVDSSCVPAFAGSKRSVTELYVPDAVTASEKRDLALRRASHPWLVYLDDDCTMPPEALEVIASEIGRASDEVGAFFCVTEFVGPRSFWFRCLEGTDFLSDFSWAREREEPGYGPTSVSVFRRSSLIEIGGFDTTLGIPAGGEDVDVCLRLRRSGARLRGIPKTLAFHDTATWNTLAGNLARAYNYGRGESELCQRYPELVILDTRATLFLAFPFLAAAVVVVALGSTAGPAALMVPAWLLSVAVGGYAKEMLSTRKGPVKAAVLALYRLAYGCGSASRAVDLRGLVTGLDWPRIARDPPPHSLDHSILISWISACVGALLALGLVLRSA